MNSVMCTGLKIAGCLFAASALCTLVYFGVRRIISCASPPDTDCIDGGVVKRYNADMPKNIESADIAEFHYETSLFAVDETDGLGNRVYKLDAILDGEKVTVKYDWYDRQGDSDKAEYEETSGFMTRLQKIVSEYDFAQHNGYYHTVSGLPHMYGAILEIVYASGERIYVHDNQDGFLPLEAEKALIMLFGAATKPNNE